jgi:lipopolysaccharide export system permease protein
MSFQFWIFFASGILVFSLIFLVSDFLSNSSQFTTVSRVDLVRYYFYMLPETVYRMIPVASLVGVLFTMAHMQKTNELVALFSLGVSLWQVTGVLLFWSTVTSVGALAIGDRWVPQAIQEKKYLYFNHIEKKPGSYSIIKTGRIWYKVKDTIFYIQTLNPVSNTAEGLKMFIIGPDWNLIEMIDAKQVEFKKNLWKLKDGLITLLRSDSQFPVTREFSEKTIVMSEEAGSLAETAKPSDVLSMKELKQFILRNRDAGLDTLRYEVDYFSKWSFAFAGFVMSLLAIPFSIRKGRSGGIMGNIGIVLGLVFFYWTFYSSGLALGYHDRLPPFISAALPSLMMFLMGIWGIQKTRY